MRHMITGAIKNQIDQIWNAFWSGGISNPLEVIEQITYLPFLRRLHPTFLGHLVASSRGKRYFFKSAKQTTGIASINIR